MDYECLWCGRPTSSRGYCSDKCRHEAPEGHFRSSIGSDLEPESMIFPLTFMAGWLAAALYFVYLVVGWLD
jgi:hypothetical protein